MNYALLCYELNISIDHFTIGIMNVKPQAIVHHTSVHYAYAHMPPYVLWQLI